MATGKIFWYYVNGGDVYVSWDEVEKVLGHEHTGSAGDDRKLVDALLSAGAPSWVKDSPDGGFVDEHGWGIYNPRINNVNRIMSTDEKAGY